MPIDRDHDYKSNMAIYLEKLYPRLNPAQREAVCSVNGPLLVLAGAGSGKTTVLVNRIYHIINFGDLFDVDGVPPCGAEEAAMLAEASGKSKAELEQCLKSMAVNPASPDRVLCITFTNKAAGEFKARLAAILGDDAKTIWAGTFHSVCARILRKHIKLIGFTENFTICDADDAKKLIAQIMKDLRVDEKILPVKAAAGAISREKENRVLPEEATRDADDPRSRRIAEIYTEYQKRLKASGTLDFDDIILYTLLIFEKFPEVLNYYGRKFEYILVDEYQDTNPSQNDLVVLLGHGRRNVCVVGDDDQSIYSFRGATVDNILNFDRAFPDAKIIKLEQNYRSTKTILEAANAVIANNKGRKGKNLWTSGAEGDKITKRCLYTQNEEADYICGEIMRLHAYGKPLKDIAVLYRVNAISNSLETAFVKNRLPYKVFGGVRFYERREIKDMVAYLSLIANPSDNLRLRRIINVPKRQIGEATVEALAKAASKDGISMLEASKRSANYPELRRSCLKLEKFYALIADLADFATVNGVAAVINEVIARTGYADALIAENENDRVEIVREFASSGVLYEQANENPTLSGFLEDVALVSDTDDYDSENETVSLMTVHSAKGLEFPTVFIAGFEEGVFPSMMSMQEGNIEEERRLAYVAITRAKEKLYITHTQSRTLYGFTAPSRVSSFLGEIPEKHIDPGEAPKTEKRYAKSEGFSAGKYDRRLPVNRVTSAEPFGAAVRSEPKAGAALVPGDKVEHKFFGKGRVISYEPMGSDALIEVEFENGQTKKLMASFAKLIKI